MEKTHIAERVRMMAEANRIPHAVLIEGNDSTLRDHSADWLAAAIVCSSTRKPCGVCRDCKKAFSNIHPDITVTGADPKQKYIRVDDIRKIRHDAYIKPNEAEARVFIIRNADNMNEEAQNALLKLLEEPPETVGLILCAASRSRLLSTVRSRLLQINVDGESSRRRADVAIHDEAKRIVTCAASKDGYGLLKALHDVTSDRVSAAKLFFDAKKGFMSAVSVKNGADIADDAIQEAASRLTLEQLIKLCDWCEDGISKMNANANKGSAAVWLSVRANRIIGI